MPITNLLKEAGLVASTSEANRMIKQGAVKLNGKEKVTYNFDFRQSVIDLIKKNIPKLNYDYGIILGDNMYKQTKDLFIEAGVQGRKRTLKKKK